MRTGLDFFLFAERERDFRFRERERSLRFGGEAERDLCRLTLRSLERERLRCRSGERRLGDLESRLRSFSRESLRLPERCVEPRSLDERSRCFDLSLEDLRGERALLGDFSLLAGFLSLDFDWDLERERDLSFFDDDSFTASELFMALSLSLLLRSLELERFLADSCERTCSIAFKVEGGSFCSRSFCVRLRSLLPPPEPCGDPPPRPLLLRSRDRERLRERERERERERDLDLDRDLSFLSRCLLSSSRFRISSFFCCINSAGMPVSLSCAESSKAHSSPIN